MKSFDDILNQLEQTDRQALESIAAKRPELRQGWMRQDDYSRKMDELKGRENSFQAIQEYAQNWDSWAEKNWDQERQATKAEIALQQRLQELEQNEMTFADIEKFVADKGLVDKNGFEQILSAKEKAINDSFQGSAYVSAKLAELSSNHTLEFKDRFKATEFLAKVHEYGVSDLDKAYDMYVSPIRKERDDAKLAERLATVEKEAIEKGRREAIETFTAQNGGSAMPVSDSSNDLGHFQRKLQGITNEDAVPEGRSAAQFAAEKYRQNKLAGVA